MYVHVIQCTIIDRCTIMYPCSMGTTMNVTLELQRRNLCTFFYKQIRNLCTYEHNVQCTLCSCKNLFELM